MYLRLGEGIRDRSLKMINSNGFINLFNKYSLGADNESKHSRHCAICCGYNMNKA